MSDFEHEHTGSGTDDSRTAPNPPVTPQPSDESAASRALESKGLHFHFCARSDVGAVREQNEDSGYASARTLAVADGLGGHAGGEVASTIAIAAVASVDPSGSPTTVSSMLDTAVNIADDGIDAAESGNPELSGMGTTLTAVSLADHTLVVCHIGDSRGYLLRDGVLIPLTVDHTYIQQLIDAGRLTPEQAAHHPQRSVILRALGGGEAVADIAVRDAKVGDRVLLCSDGLSGVVPNEMIERVLTGYADVTAAVDALVDLALLAGAPDNVTVVLGDVTAKPAQPVGAALVGAARDPRNHNAITNGNLHDALAVASGSAQQRRPSSHTGSSRRFTVSRPLLRGIAVAVLVITSLTAMRSWVYSHWWVGVDGGHVVVGRGIPQPVLGLRLGTIVRTTSIDVRTLPAYYQQQLADSTAPRSHTGADTYVRNLACMATPVASECTP